MVFSTQFKNPIQRQLLLGRIELFILFTRENNVAYARIFEMREVNYLDSNHPVRHIKVSDVAALNKEVSLAYRECSSDRYSYHRIQKPAGLAAQPETG
jgi:hypothetical protein